MGLVSVVDMISKEIKDIYRWVLVHNNNSGIMHKDGSISYFKCNVGELLALAIGVVND